MRTLRKIVFLGLGAVALMAALLVLLGPFLVDTPAVRAEIQRRLAHAIQGEVRWDALALQILPAPHAALTNVRVRVPHKFEAEAEGLDAYLRLWPLLRGDVEVSSVTARKPAVRLLLGPDSKAKSLDPIAAYRALMEPAARALQEFAPDMTLRVEQGAIDRFRHVHLEVRTSASGVDLEASLASDLWQRLAGSARVEYADLSARARASVEALVLDPDVPPLTLRADLRTDGKSLLEGEFDASAGALGQAKGKLVHPANKLTAQVTGIDAAQAIAIARRKVGGLDAIEGAEGKVSADVEVHLQPAWRAQAALTRSDASVKLKLLPWKIAADAGRVTVTQGQVQVSGARGRIGDSVFEGAAAQIELGAAPRVSAASGQAKVELKQWLPWLKSKLPLDDVASLSGSAELKLNRLALRFDKPQDADYDVSATLGNVSAALKLLPAPLAISGGAVHADRKRVRLNGVRGRVGESSFEAAAARIELGKTPRVSSASGQAKVKLEQWLPWLKARMPLEDIESAAGNVEVALQRLALRFDRPHEADYDAIATLGKASAVLKMLPAPVSASGGSVQVTPAQVRISAVAAAMLDARGTFSGAFDRQSASLSLSAVDGASGEKLVRWAMERYALPARFEPRTPLRIPAARIAWAPKQPLELEARLEVERGPQVGVALSYAAGALNLRRVTLKDAASDATLSARIAPNLIEGSFAGTLTERSVAALRRDAPPPGAGTLSGELLFSTDRAQPERSVAEGRLRIQALDLSWLVGKRAIIESVDLSADKAGVRIADASLDWEQQRFRLRGQVRRTERFPVIDAVLESPGIDLARVLPPRSQPDTAEQDGLWPLPLRGRIEVRSAYVEHGTYRAAPFDGVLTLEAERARLEVKQAAMCGVSFPLALELQPGRSSLDMQLVMQDQPFEKSLHCLTGGTVVITGNADLQADLRVQGRRPHLLRDMTGSAHLVLRNGEVRKFAALGNILSVRNIADVGRMNQEGFPYRTMVAKGRFQNGEFLLDEGAFDSRAAHLAATGRVDMLGDKSRLTVLVGIFTIIDRIAGGIPILSDIFGGSLTALPVAVSGDIRDPLVVPLGPSAISERLLEIMSNTAKLPAKLFEPEAK